MKDAAVVAAVIGAIAAVIAALIPVVFKKKEAQGGNAGIAGSPGSVLVTGSQNVQITAGASQAQMQGVKQSLSNIHALLKQSLPNVTQSQAQEALKIDALLHPNRWRPLPGCRFVMPRGAEPEKALKAMISEALLELSSYAAHLASPGQYRRLVLNVIHEDRDASNEMAFTFTSNDAAFIGKLSEILSEGGVRTRMPEIVAFIKNWSFLKKFAFVGGACVDMQFDPARKLVEFRNAPIFEGEGTENAAILQKAIAVDKVAAQNISSSVSKALGLVGRMGLCANTHDGVILNFDIDDGFGYPPNFLRLVMHSVKKNMADLDLFRISVDDPEAWDYVYQKP